MSTPTVTICINNYNYARFLPAAIDSALAQEGEAVQVVVVDDGSTDGSRQVIEAYGDRVVAVLKPNGGQGSAFNAGMAVATGRIVVFLDADDVLVPRTAAMLTAAFRQAPRPALVQYRLEVIDDQGRPTGEVRPRRRGTMPNGDLAAHVLRHRSYHWQPTSGLAFDRGALDRMLPVPEDFYRISADAYLAELVPFCGPVVSLDEIGGRYRVHRSNNYDTSRVEAAFFRKKIEQISTGHRTLRSLAPQLGLTDVPDEPTDARDVAFLGFRLASIKLDPAHHPIPGDDALHLAARGTVVSLTSPLLPWTQRLKRAAWFAVMGPAPRGVAHALVQRYTPDAPPRRRR